jgi:hypothetical protein
MTPIIRLLASPTPGLSFVFYHIICALKDFLVNVSVLPVKLPVRQADVTTPS